jgi:tetratricopeptide (TPR) repeat protein
VKSLAVYLYSRYENAGDESDLADSIRFIKQELDATPDGPDKAWTFHGLGDRLHDSYTNFGHSEHLDEAVKVLRQAVALSPEGPERTDRLHSLGACLGDRHSRTQEMADIEEAIDLARQTVEATSDCLSRVIYLQNLGANFLDRYYAAGDMEDLEQAIGIARQTIEADRSNEGGPHSHFIIDLASRLQERFQVTGKFQDLENAVLIAREAIASKSPRKRPLEDELDILSSILMDRYRLTGDAADFDEALDAKRRAVNQTSDSNPRKSLLLNNLGTILATRYSRSGALEYLEEAIQIQRRAISIALPDDGRRPALQDTLASLLSLRYARVGKASDSEEAFQISKEIAENTPSGHPDRSRWLGNHAARLVERYHTFKDVADLDEAIKLLRQAIQITPESHPFRTKLLHDLACRLWDKELIRGPAADFDEATKIFERILEIAPDNHPERVTYLCNLGNMIVTRYDRNGQLSDFERALNCFRSAMCQPNASLIDHLTAGATMLQVCLTHAHWQHAFEAAEFVFQRMPNLALRSLDNEDKQHLLGLMAEVASDGVAAALFAEKGCLAALNLLEQGRGVLAESIEAMRVDIMQLQDRHPEMAKEFVRLRDELEGDDSGSDDEDSLPRGDQRYKTGKEFDELIEDIRALPEFSSFLGPPSEFEIQGAAVDGPLVIINVSQYRCDALLVEEDQTRVLPLPNLYREEITKKAKKKDLGNHQILEWLWDTVAEPTLEALGLSRTPAGENWPRIWWIPTGPLSRFPLHAAGHHRQGLGETVLDRVVSSYSSSIKAIIHGRARRRASTDPSQALLVAVENTLGQDRLRFATQEVAELRKICGKMRLTPVEPVRKKEKLKECLQNCKIFHFAGHCSTSYYNPLHSHLFLDDGDANPLRVADLLDINLHVSAPFLAYLSACGTGQILDETFIDESIHLISACQLAGFRHVIGTLWDVDDKFCVEMASITYGVIEGSKMSDESVSRGLHKASRELRESSLGDLMEFRKTRRRSRSDRTSDEGADTSSNVGDNGGGGLTRKPKFLYSDDEDDLETGLLNWVPYVHFGV